MVLGYDEKLKTLQVLLIKRSKYPYEGAWALPGGFVDMNETAEKCVLRELKEETGLKDVKFEQLFTASKVDRDPRGRTISVIFWALIKTNYQVKGSDDATEAKWFDVLKLPVLAFDHKKIIKYAISQLKFRLKAKKYFKDFFTNINSDEVFDNLKIVIKNYK